MKILLIALIVAGSLAPMQASAQQKTNKPQTEKKCSKDQAKHCSKHDMKNCSDKKKANCCAKKP